MQFTFDTALLCHIDLADLPANWMAQSMASAVQEIGDVWVQAQESSILQVPSAAISGEYNYLLNPAHPDANKISTGPIEPFSFDPRLQKQ